MEPNKLSCSLLPSKTHTIDLILPSLIDFAGSLQRKSNIKFLSTVYLNIISMCERERHVNSQALAEEHYERYLDQEEEYMREATSRYQQHDTILLLLCKKHTKIDAKENIQVHRHIQLD